MCTLLLKWSKIVQSVNATILTDCLENWYRLCTEKIDFRYTILLFRYSLSYPCCANESLTISAHCRIPKQLLVMVAFTISLLFTRLLNCKQTYHETPSQKITTWMSSITNSSHCADRYKHPVQIFGPWVYFLSTRSFSLQMKQIQWINRVQVHAGIFCLQLELGWHLNRTRQYFILDEARLIGKSVAP